jgi:hypothetical protein
MEWVVYASARFKIVTTVLVLLSIAVKSLTNSSVLNPSPNDIASSLATFLQHQDFVVAGPVSIGGVEAVLARKDQCIAYFVPMAHQGWHEAILRQQLQPNQELWFVFEGRLTHSRQPTFWPTFEYYKMKSARYLFRDSQMPILLGIIPTGTCDLKTVDWSKLPSVPFQT